MTEILFNDDDPILTSTDANDNQTIPLPANVLIIDESFSTSSVRKDSIVIPSISNHSISSVIQIDNQTNNTNSNTLLPVCTSNSLGKEKFNENFFLKKLVNSFQEILVQLHYLCWTILQQIFQSSKKIRQQ